MQLLIRSAFVFAIATAIRNNPQFKEKRSGIVSLFEWPFASVAQECETFLGPHQFGGVQVSPVNEVAIMTKPHRSWLERYRPISYKLASRSGNKQEFEEMVRRCNRAGVRVYVDVVLNHMAGGATDTLHGTGGSTANPIERSYPAVPYTSANFHVTCSLRNYTNAVQLRNCSDRSTPDIDQSQEPVRLAIVHFLNRLIDIGVAGFRVDTAEQMSPIDLQAIYSRLKNLNTAFDFPDDTPPFIYHDVRTPTGLSSISKTDYTRLGAVADHLYAHGLGTAFRGRHGKDLHDLMSWGVAWDGFLPGAEALVFVDNHESQRHTAAPDNPNALEIITHKHPKLYKMATAFMLAHPYGIPLIMSSFAFSHTEDGPPADEQGNIIGPQFNEAGQCTNGWICEHRWRSIYGMIEFRNVVAGTEIQRWADDGKFEMAFCRGEKGYIAFNGFRSMLFKATLDVCVPPGTYCDIITGKLVDGACTGRTIHVDASKKATITIQPDQADGVVAIHVGQRI